MSFKTDLSPIWCPGCGNYTLLNSLIREVLLELGILNHQLAIISGIGCCSRIPGYIDSYGFNALHGRATVIGQGVKIGSKIKKTDLRVMVIGGDGDLFAIGCGHLPHLVRRNLDLTLIMVNNFVYALTKGQTSPTTPLLEEEKTLVSSPGINPPVDPILDILAYSISTKASLVAQGISSNPSHLSQILKQAILHPGFSFVGVLSYCPTYTADLFEALRNKAHYLEKGKKVELPSGESFLHDPENINLAFKLAQVPILERPYLGIFFEGKG
jgi:2-oxoglutarate ferredoxin oxidoreductase subunit beta